jgi:hypothetical protein
MKKTAPKAAPVTAIFWRGLSSTMTFARRLPHVETLPQQDSAETPWPIAAADGEYPERAIPPLARGRAPRPRTGQGGLKQAKETAKEQAKETANEHANWESLRKLKRLRQFGRTHDTK